MNINNIITVIKRELRDKLYSKAFVFMTLLIPGIMILSIGVQSLFMSIDGDEGTKIQVISQSAKISDKVKEKLSELPFIKNNYYKVTFLQKSESEFNDYYTEIKPQLLADSKLSIIYIPDSVLFNKQVKFLSKNPINNPLFMKLKGPLNEVFVDIYFEGKELTKEEIDFARLSVDFEGLRVTEDAKAKEEGFGNLIISFVFTFLLYISLLLLGQLMMRAVVEEKNNRIVEIILSSISSKDLMVGKILGSTITGLAQMAIWLSPIILLITTTWFALPKELTFNLNGWQIFYYLLNFLMGLLTYLAFFATMVQFLIKTKKHN